MAQNGRLRLRDTKQDVFGTTESAKSKSTMAIEDREEAKFTTPLRLTLIFTRRVK